MNDMNDKKILDMTCAGRSIWFNKRHPNAVYCDIREGDHERIFGKQYKGTRSIHIHPDIIADFTSLPFEDNSFALVVLDPPHLTGLKPTAWLAKEYGVLPREGWQDVLKKGVQEGMRVLKNDGVLILKWCEIEIKTSDLIRAIGIEPLFGHHSGKKSNTHWLCFMKGVSDNGIQ